MELKNLEAGQRKAVEKVTSLFLILKPEEQLKVWSMLIDLERNGISYVERDGADYKPVAPVQLTWGE